MDRRLKIAVADDDRDTREYLQEFLSYLGHDVRAAGDGRQLVEVCRDFAPDLIVTDFAMPGLDGLTAAAEIRRARPVPVILISGRQDVELPPEAPDVPAIRFLAKPVKDAELRAAIASAAQVAVSLCGDPR